MGPLREREGPPVHREGLLTVTVRCRKSGCQRTWDRDPCREVECPTCGANVGARCQRPSGHSGNFVSFHKARDLKALEEGHYGECPSGRCPETLEELNDGDPDQADLSSFGT